MKRFQDCNWLVKIWRYRFYIPIPFKWLWFQNVKPFYVTNDETLQDEAIRGVSFKTIINNIIILLTPKSKRKDSIVKCQLWSLLIGIAQQKMEWYYTWEEVRSRFNIDPESDHEYDYIDIEDDIDESEYWRGND